MSSVKGTNGSNSPSLPGDISLIKLAVINGCFQALSVCCILFKNSTVSLFFCRTNSGILNALILDPAPFAFPPLLLMKIEFLFYFVKHNYLLMGY